MVVVIGELIVALGMALLLQIDENSTSTGVVYGLPLPSNTVTVKLVVPLADKGEVPMVKLLKLTLGADTE